MSLTTAQKAKEQEWMDKLRAKASELFYMVEAAKADGLRVVIDFDEVYRTTRFIPTIRAGYSLKM